VRGYMVRDPVTVGEDTGLGELQSAIIERHAGFLPVMFAGKLSGIVTRSDVLRAIHKATSRGRAGLAEASPVREATDKGRELLSLLPPRYVSILAAAGEVADAIGVACYLVGGIVRDLVLDRRNIDIDFLVEGDGIAFAKKLGATLEAHVVENSRFRTAKISLSDGLHIDIATAREEFYLHPGALPEVEAASIRDDLLRRDFTINTLAIQLNSRKWGLLIDHFGGLSDLNIGLIRVLHTFSFVDDPTRILRALRFSARYGFPLEKQTEELLKRALLEGRLDDVSPERLRAEILLCLRESNPWAVLRRICDQGVFGLLHPPLQPPLCMSEPEDQIKPALEWVAGFMDAQDVPRRSLVYFAYLISTTLSADAIGFVQHYRFDSTVMEIAKSLEDLRGAEVELADRDLKPSRIVAILENLPAPFWVVLASGKSDISPERAHIRRFLTELRWTQPEISGDDLVTEGFEPGPRFGEALDAIRRAKLDGEISGREEEIAIAKRLLAGK